MKNIPGDSLEWLDEKSVELLTAQYLFVGQFVLLEKAGYVGMAQTNIQTLHRNGLVGAVRNIHLEIGQVANENDPPHSFSLGEDFARSEDLLKNTRRLCRCLAHSKTGP